MASQTLKLTYTTHKRPHGPVVSGRVIRGGRRATRKG